MDCSWLLEDAEEEPASETDDEQVQSELEARLYSIVHHNDLSQPLAPELAEHYSVQCADDGQVLVTLKHSLEDVKLQESGQNDNISTNLEPDNEDTNNVQQNVDDEDEVIIVSEGHHNDKETQWNVKEKQYSRKKFRYSDVNLDVSNENEVKERVESSKPNYFKLSPNFFNNNKNKQFTHLTLPSPCTLNSSSLNDSDWRIDANESFISVGSAESPQDYDTIKKMISVLRRLNPLESVKKLKVFAQLLFRRNARDFRKKEKKRKKAIRNSQIRATTLDLSYEDTFHNNQPQNSHVEHLKRNSIQNGSISLNISPFRPDPPLIDLLSEDEKNISTETTPKCSRSLLKSHLPSKWSKKMINFYTKSNKNCNMELDTIVEDFRNTTVADDWKLDKVEFTGRPLSNLGRKASRKCANCNERGHMVKDCYKPKKTPTCSLCGEFFHSDYMCPNKICSKCGVFTTSDGYGGECNTCYYSTFENDVPCEICGKVTHRTAMCTDLWRSFHATTEGEKKIPEKVIENKRKYCCNCARRGHFSHDCPFLMYAGQQTSSFVTNYSATPSEKGTAEIILSHSYSNILNDNDADLFFQNLSNSTKALISFEDLNSSIVFRINGTFEQCKRVKTEIESYVNTRKRKREGPSPKRKRRRIDRR